MIAVLVQHVAELERRIQILEQNEQHRSQLDSSRLSRPDFSAVKDALANYHQAIFWTSRDKLPRLTTRLTHIPKQLDCPRPMPGI